MSKLTNCKDCGKELSDEESYYYEYRCEECEKDFMDRVDRWISGEDDPMLDILYGA